MYFLLSILLIFKRYYIKKSVLSNVSLTSVFKNYTPLTVILDLSAISVLGGIHNNVSWFMPWGINN